MKLKQLLKQVEKLKQKYPDIEDWDVYVETEMYTYGEKYSINDEIIQHNKETLDKINVDKKAGWKFIECPTYNSNNELMDIDYYKGIEGGIGIIPESKNLLICINY